MHRIEIDHIVKVGLLQSIPVYFFAFIGFGFLIKEGYINVDILATCILALIATVAHFSIVVWYRKRKEHAVTSKTPSVTTPPQKLYKNLKIGIITLLMYVLYLYTSVERKLIL